MSRPTIFTIGYEGVTQAEFLAALTAAGVKRVIDVRAIPNSRRPGFSKTPLRNALAEEGIDYVHLRALGTPADGRAAARAGRHAEMHAIFARHLATEQAQTELHALADLVRGGRRVCLLCFEADPAHCHRTLVADALRELVDIEVHDLRPEHEDEG